jgi:Tfp pilus assembly protein PilZ
MSKERRRAERHVCKTPVGYAVQDLSFIDYIQDINAWGVFIQSEQKLPVGESILMTLPLFGNETAIKVVGEVVWSGAEGMGVRFDMGIGQPVVDSVLEGCTAER